MSCVAYMHSEGLMHGGSETRQSACWRPAPPTQLPAGGVKGALLHPSAWDWCTTAAVQACRAAFAEHITSEPLVLLAPPLHKESCASEPCQACCAHAGLPNRPLLLQDPVPEEWLQSMSMENFTGWMVSWQRQLACQQPCQVAAPGPDGRPHSRLRAGRHAALHHCSPASKPV